MFEFHVTALPDVIEVTPRTHRDHRGSFVKTFHAPSFAERGLETGFVEQFHTVSSRNVLRGLHFQNPPHDHVKLVHCSVGEVLDVAVDVRRGSPTYGGHVSLILSAERGNMIYLPSGFAHGFLVLSDTARVVYNVSTVHAPAADAGLRWDSAGVPWPCVAPILSPRDQALPPLAEFDSQFIYDSRPENAARRAAS